MNRTIDQVLIRDGNCTPSTALPHTMTSWNFFALFKRYINKISRLYGSKWEHSFELF